MNEPALVLDASCLSIRRTRGIPRYAESLFAALAKRYSGPIYWFVRPGCLLIDDPIDGSALNFVRSRIPERIRKNRLAYEDLRMFRVGCRESVMILPNFAEGNFADVEIGMPICSIVPDLIPLRWPEVYAPVYGPDRYKHWATAAATLSKHAVVCTMSEFVGGTIRELIHPAPKKIHNISAGVDHGFFKHTGQARDHFILCVGDNDPRKGCEELVRAMALGKIDRPLVLVGTTLPSWVDHLNTLAKRLGVRLTQTGQITDEALLDLYSRCACLVYPSKDEGFGLPIVEAQATGATVVVSTAASLPEVAGSTAHYCDPDSLESIAESINEALSRPVAALNSQMNAWRFTWERAADKLLDAINIPF